MLEILIFRRQLARNHYQCLPSMVQKCQVLWKKSSDDVSNVCVIKGHDYDNLPAARLTLQGFLSSCKGEYWWLFINMLSLSLLLQTKKEKNNNVVMWNKNISIYALFLHNFLWKIHRGGSRYGPIRPRPPFWQLNHANSAYFGALSVNFPSILTLGSLFLQILGPALIHMEFLMFFDWQRALHHNTAFFDKLFWFS